MKVEFNVKTEKIKSGTLVRFNDKGLSLRYYAIYLTDMNEENPILYDLETNQYYNDIDMYNIEPVICAVKLVVE